MTGRDHCDIERMIVLILGDINGVTDEFIYAIHAIVEFIYRVQDPIHTDSSTSANYFVLCKAVDCCTVSIAPPQGPGWTASPNGNLAMQPCVQLWKMLLQAQAKYYGVL